ncbi:uncharacterized protein LOC108344477 [Vigna angularis]|uniref:uncharacterized protein LOC108344477 n=1 Tax=Phaseolus angularis TaxID=3914 RepID=UPI0022B52C7A|nr:uncharacterized protein LOC108344477 [Vigna angularis]
MARVLEKTKLEVNSQKSQPVRVGGLVVSRGGSSSRRTPYSRPPSHGSMGSFSQSSVPSRQSTHSGGGVIFVVVRDIMARTVLLSEEQASRRVYALFGSEAASSGTLIVGSCLLNGKECCVLFDFGATHSFVFEDCFADLGLVVRELQYDLAVATPTSGLVKTSTLCSRCSVVVEERQFKVNLICLPLQGLDVILGMDWLSANRILIDCGEKKLVFSEEEETVLLSSGQLKQELVEGACCFLVLLHMAIEQSGHGLDHSIVSDFLDVFPEEVSGLPPQREVEFLIDLVPKAGPLSISPYRMTLAELVELKKQIEDFLEK